MGMHPRKLPFLKNRF